MKKLGMLFMSLFLVACSRIEGESIVSCVDDATTVMRIEGYDDEILRWTVSTTSSRDEFEQEVLQGVPLSQMEIIHLFARYNQRNSDGILFQIAELNNAYIVMEVVYDYTLIPIETLNSMWHVEDFENDVTLSAAIAGLEEQGLICQVAELNGEAHAEG
ncbi:MAG: hypothetical protein FWG67_04245 [Defluviitaleaceae bacterium]|nr:hypothetical protein [Defluviitaleaceae bacterium]